MKLIPTAIPGVVIVEPDVFGDARGFFMESWNERSFAELGLDMRFVQDNHSRSQQGVLRGLHYQLAHPQGKLVRVTQGEVFDVAVDLRSDSPTFGRSVGERLSEENQRMLWIPPGFAHGFYVISAQADFQYKCTDFYMPDDERAIRWDDPELGIEWPLVSDAPPNVSARDAAAPLLRDAEVYEA
jgi:dTDP-4-dehydrorhamnose 3,5-epimerase